MPGHGRDDYTLERMLERRHRNNIRKYLERNGRRMTARVYIFFLNFIYKFSLSKIKVIRLSTYIMPFFFQDIDIVNLCTRYPDQRY